MRLSLAFSLSVTLCLTIATAATAEVYKTVDKQGRVTYTDLPPADTQAKVVELPHINSLPPTESTESVSPRVTQNAPSEYEVAIVKPEDGTTLTPGERSIEVSVSVNQNLEENLFSYRIDGEVIEETSSDTITLEEPGRGERKLTVSVINAEGEVLASSPPITLIVLRPTILQKKPIVPVKK